MINIEGGLTVILIGVFIALVAPVSAVAAWAVKWFRKKGKR